MAFTRIHILLLLLADYVRNTSFSTLGSVNIINPIAIGMNAWIFSTAHPAYRSRARLIRLHLSSLTEYTYLYIGKENDYA